MKNIKDSDTGKTWQKCLSSLFNLTFGGGTLASTPNLLREQMWVFFLPWWDFRRWADTSSVPIFTTVPNTSSLKIIYFFTSANTRHKSQTCTQLIKSSVWSVILLFNIAHHPTHYLHFHTPHNNNLSLLLLLYSVSSISDDSILQKILIINNHSTILLLTNPQILKSHPPAIWKIARCCRCAREKNTNFNFPCNLCSNIIIFVVSLLHGIYYYKTTHHDINSLYIAGLLYTSFTFCFRPSSPSSVVSYNCESSYNYYDYYYIESLINWV